MRELKSIHLKGEYWRNKHCKQCIEGFSERKKIHYVYEIVGGTKGPDGAGDMVDVDIISNQYKNTFS